MERRVGNGRTGGPGIGTCEAESFRTRPNRRKDNDAFAEGIDMNRSIAWVAAAILIGIVGAPAAQAGAATTPKASGVYPLAPGIFVLHGTGCGDPPNAAIKLYDGKGLGTAHTSACVAHVTATKKTKDGTAFAASQTCNDEGDGSGKPFTENQSVVVDKPTRFFVPDKHGDEYDYCPVDQLPDGLRSAVPPAHAGA